MKRLARLLRAMADRIDPPSLSFHTQIPGGFSNLRITRVRRID